MSQSAPSANSSLTKAAISTAGASQWLAALPATRAFCAALTLGSIRSCARGSRRSARTAEVAKGFPVPSLSRQRDKRRRDGLDHVSSGPAPSAAGGIFPCSCGHRGDRRDRPVPVPRHDRVGGPEPGPAPLALGASQPAKRIDLPSSFDSAGPDVSLSKRCRMLVVRYTRTHLAPGDGDAQSITDRRRLDNLSTFARFMPAARSVRRAGGCVHWRTRGRDAGHSRFAVTPGYRLRVTVLTQLVEPTHGRCDRVLVPDVGLHGAHLRRSAYGCCTTLLTAVGQSVWRCPGKASNCRTLSWKAAFSSS